MIRIKFEENASPEIRQAAEEGYIVILPLGCIEQHGPHLPVGCDYGSPLDAVDLARQRHGAKALVLPTLPFGPAAEHTAFPGTISLSFEVWCNVIIEIVDNLVRDGFRRIVISKGCGGHMGLEGPVYQYYCRVKRQLKDLDIRIFGEQGWAEIGKVIAESGIETDGEVHAGGVETSMALASRPELVHLDRLARPKKQGRSWSSSWWIMEELSDTGATGNPMVYDLELGKRITERMAQVFADFLGEMWRTRPVPVHKGSVG